MPSDRTLMRRVRERDEQAFSVLVGRHQVRLRAVAGRLLGSWPDAEDAVQRTFLQVLTAARSYRPEWAVSTWMRRILMNICVDEIRRRRVRLEHRAALAGMPADPAGRVRSADGAGARLDVQRALRKVPTEARVLLVLRYVDGMSYGEMARVRGISINTVKSQMARGKSIMRTALQEDRT